MFDHIRMLEIWAQKFYLSVVLSRILYEERVVYSAFAAYGLYRVRCTR